MGVVSIITGVTIFIGGQQAQAAETSVQHADAHPEDSQTTQQLKNDKVEETLKASKVVMLIVNKYKQLINLKQIKTTNIL